MFSSKLILLSLNPILVVLTPRAVACAGDSCPYMGERLMPPVADNIRKGHGVRCHFRHCAHTCMPWI